MSSAFQYDSYGVIGGSISELFLKSGLPVSKSDGSVSQYSIHEATSETLGSLLGLK